MLTNSAAGRPLSQTPEAFLAPIYSYPTDDGNSEEALRSADYYTTSYEPGALLEQYRALKDVLARGEEGCATYCRAWHHAPAVVASATPPRAGESRATDEKEEDQASPHKRRRPRPHSLFSKPQSSLALEVHYARRRHRQQQQQPNVLAPDDSARSASSSTSSMASSVGSTYERHHRYDVARTAYAAVSEPYDGPREHARQSAFFDECRRLGKPFVPTGGGGGGLQKPTRLLLGDCVRALYRSIAKDWPEAEPTVLSTAEDLIVVYFSLRQLKKRQAAVVLKYMNGSLHRSDVVRQYSLVKVSEGWDVLTKDGRLMYTLRPPWVSRHHFLPDTIVPPKAHR